MNGYIFEITPDKLLIETTYDGIRTKVVVADGDFKAAGWAKVAEGDTFDYNIGYTLAYSRAYARVLRKIEKAIARNPEEYI